MGQMLARAANRKDNALPPSLQQDPKTSASPTSSASEQKPSDDQINKRAALIDFYNKCLHTEPAALIQMKKTIEEALQQIRLRDEQAMEVVQEELNHPMWQITVCTLDNSQVEDSTEEIEDLEKRLEIIQQVWRLAVGDRTVYRYDPEASTSTAACQSQV